MSVAVLKGHQRGRTTAKLSAVLHVGRAVERLIWLNRAKRPCDILGGGMALWCGTFNAYSALVGKFWRQAVADLVWLLWLLWLMYGRGEVRACLIA